MARWWFEAAVGDPFADVVAGLRDGEVALPRSGVRTGGHPWGAPGSMWASLTRYANLAGKVASRRAWSARGWTTFLDGLEKFPAAAEMQLVELDDRGYRRHADLASITVDVVGDDDRWFRMGCEFASFPHGPHHRIARMTDAQARDFLWDALQNLPATFAGVGDDGQMNGPTMLESRLRRDAIAGVLQSQEVLRGYPWVTVCGPEIAARLGGPDTLRASGGFHDVLVLPTGSVWLQATETLADYQDEALHRVFRTLAPVLPPGKPEPYAGREVGRIVYEDARQYAAS
jgi:hypothetical protein